ncbi:MAG: hypothetical protein KAW12_19955 [Candidatus Aminicenantes bacterium]|nr:hypothetical protein [Candidatus Aminicenantes bacterium]
MKKSYVVDTTSLISYFGEVFSRPRQISHNALHIIDKAFKDHDSINLSIPSIVFVEIFEKWFKDEETSAKIRSEIMTPIYAAPNIEIKPLDKEVLENFLKIRDSRIKFDNHDKIILASSMMLQWPLITSDSKIIKYNKRHRVVPDIIS